MNREDEKAVIATLTDEQRDALISRITWVVDRNSGFETAPVLYMFGANDAFRKAITIIEGDGSPYVHVGYDRRKEGTRIN